MLRTRTILISCLGLCLAATRAVAQEDLPQDPVGTEQTPSTETALFLEIPSVYGAAKYDPKVNEAPAAVIIITAEQIRKYGYRTFAQILDSAPSLFTNNDRNYGYLNIRNFNQPGDYTSRILLLIDNHRLNDAVFDQGGAGTEMPIDVDLVDRVEIIKGPGSSLYGTNALFGVVNVITKRGRDLKGAEVSGEASSFNTYRSRLSYGNKFSNGVEMLVSGSFSDSEGHRELSYPAFASTNNGIAKDADRDNLYYYTGKLSYADFTLTGGHQWRKKNVPTAAFGTVFNDNRQHTLDERTYLDLVYQHEFAYQLNVKARLYKPGQPNVLHKIISLYLTNSQAQVTQLRQAWQGRDSDAIRATAHSLKSSSATLGAHRLATLAKQLEEACWTAHVEQAEGLIMLIEIAHRDACVIFRNELQSSPKEAA